MSGDNSNANFFDILQNYKVIFKKSQVSSVRMAKEDALLTLREEYLLKFGQEITIDQLKKKIQNMRSNVKKKTFVCATGKKPNDLKAWERGLLQLMEEETNPVHFKIPDAMDVGVVAKIQSDCFEPETPKAAKKKVDDELEDQAHPHLTKKPKSLDETEETRNLNNQELQRLVLLKQLRLVNLDITEREERKKEIDKKEQEIKKEDDNSLLDQ